MQKTLIITCGEPSGISPEIIAKALYLYEGNAQFIVIGDRDHFTLPLPDSVTFLHRPFDSEITLGKPNPSYAKNILDILTEAALLCHDKPHHGLVTAPLQKETIAQYLPTFRGHTDFIADILSQTDKKSYKAVMMLCCDDLRTVPLTTHIPLSNVPSTITTDMIIQTAKIIHHDFIHKYHIQNPKIVVTGLNPHAGDKGLMGTEEETIIMPAIHILQSQGLNIHGVFAADSLFHASMRSTYDVALCMYHDQALIPVKTLGFDVGVNVTLGLPIIRTSPDHGTALSIAGKDSANPHAMLAAILEAEKLIM